MKLIIHTILLTICLSANNCANYTKKSRIKTFFKNIRAKQKAKHALADEYLDEPFIKIIVVQGIPVIIGGVGSEESITRAKKILSEHFDRVECLANRIIGFWNTDLEYKIKSKLFWTRRIASRHYTVRVIKSHVWIVGIARSEEEKQLVIEKISQIKGITLSHFIIVNTDPEDGYIIYEAWK